MVAENRQQADDCTLRIVPGYIKQAASKKIVLFAFLAAEGTGISSFWFIVDTINGHRKFDVNITIILYPKYL
jgi:hypothetical protein